MLASFVDAVGKHNVFIETSEMQERNTKCREGMERGNILYIQEVPARPTYRFDICPEIASLGLFEGMETPYVSCFEFPEIRCWLWAQIDVLVDRSKLMLVSEGSLGLA